MSSKAIWQPQNFHCNFYFFFLCFVFKKTNRMKLDVPKNSHKTTSGIYSVIYGDWFVSVKCAHDNQTYFHSSLRVSSDRKRPFNTYAQWQINAHFVDDRKSSAKEGKKPNSKYCGLWSKLSYSRTYYLFSITLPINSVFMYCVNVWLIIFRLLRIFTSACWQQPVNEVPNFPSQPKTKNQTMRAKKNRPEIYRRTNKLNDKT